MIEAATISNDFKKSAIAPVRPGDTVRVHQTIREGSKQRVQVFEGVVIRTDRLGEVSASVTVRRIASGVGVEKSFLLHSPNTKKIEIIRRAKVRRKYLSYLRQRRGKSARLTEQGFDRLAVNAANNQPEEDVAVTEVDQDAAEDAENQVVEPIAEVEQAENKEAGEADASKDADAADDEAQLDAEETKIGRDAADQAVHGDDADQAA